MSKPKLTPWYPPEVKPVRKGVYEIYTTNPPWFRYWNGTRWMWGGGTPSMAFFYRDYFPMFEKTSWRGLTERAK